MKKFFIILFTFFLASLSNAQVSTQLATITVGSPNNSAGLGVTFNGQLLSDGFLYFEGSPNGVKKSIWKTDGTKSGTKLVVEESNTFGYDWERIIFTQEGVLIFDNKVWKILRSTQNALSILPNMPSANIDFIAKSTDGNYYATFKVNNDLILYRFDENFSNIQQIGPFNPIGNSIVTTCGNYGAVSYNNNVFQIDIPLIYLKNTDKITPLLDFIKTFDPSATEAKDGIMHDDFLIINYATTNNNSVRKIINLANMEIKNFQFFRNIIEFKNYGEYFIMITKEDVIKIKKSDLSSQYLFSDVFAFTPTALIKNNLYLIQYVNNKESIVEINLDDNKVNSLPNSETGVNYYNSKFLVYKDEFYFLRENSHQLLIKYDFNNQTSQTIDTLSVRTGATVNHNLFVVKGNLVFSKRLGFLQHEPFVLGGGTTSTITIPESTLTVFPIPANNELYIHLPNEETSEDYKSRIYNLNGNGYDLSVNNGKIDISNLTAGLYFGEIFTSSKKYIFKFIKQ